MAIQLQTLFDSKVRQYSTSGGGNDRFTADFLMGTRYALSQIFVRQGDTSSSLPTDQNDEVSLNEKLEFVLAAGIDYYLLKQGQKTSVTDSENTSVKEAADRWDEALGYVTMRDLNQLSDDDEDDVVGLGYKEGH